MKKLIFKLNLLSPIRFSYLKIVLKSFPKLFLLGSNLNKKVPVNYQSMDNYWKNSPHVPDSEYYSHGD